MKERELQIRVEITEAEVVNRLSSSCSILLLLDAEITVGEQQRIGTLLNRLLLDTRLDLTKLYQDSKKQQKTSTLLYKECLTAAKNHGDAIIIDWVKKHKAELCNTITTAITKAGELGDYIFKIETNKKLIGEGVYENYATCFSRTGINAKSKRFCQVHDRLVFLTWQNVHDAEKKGRCLVWHDGKKVIYMFNHYYKNNNLSQDYIAEAYLKLWNQDTTQFKIVERKKTDSSLSPKLPIYLNSGGVRIRPKTVSLEACNNLKLNRIYYCPDCRRKHNAADYPHTVSGNTHHIGCCKAALQCSVCDDELDETEIHYYGEDAYCETCFYERFSYCEECGEGVGNEDMVLIVDKDIWVCQSCADRYYNQCDRCGNYNSEDTAAVDNNAWCLDCVEIHADFCDRCSSYTRHDTHTVIDPDTEDDMTVCDDCFNAFTECSECGSYAHKSQTSAHHGLCNACSQAENELKNTDTIEVKNA